MEIVRAAVCLSVLTGCLALPSPDGGLRIMGGGDASPLNFPWQAALLTTDNRFFCGGSIIDHQWILTAGHCVDPFAEFQVVVGSVKLPDGEAESSRQTFFTKEKHVHPQYDMVFLDNDIGLLRLPDKIKSSYFAAPVALPTYSMAMEDFAGNEATVSGWGKTTDASPASQVLKYTDLKILSNAECEMVYGNTMIGNKLCVSANNGNSVCQGDSGGALVIDWSGLPRRVVQIGITSFVSREGCSVRMPQGFTRVTSFLEYIEQVTGIPIKD